jgi:hypothetical protein
MADLFLNRSNGGAKHLQQRVIMPVRYILIRMGFGPKVVEPPIPNPVPDPLEPPSPEPLPPFVPDIALAIWAQVYNSPLVMMTAVATTIRCG